MRKMAMTMLRALPTQVRSYLLVSVCVIPKRSALLTCYLCTGFSSPLCAGCKVSRSGHPMHTSTSQQGLQFRGCKLPQRQGSSLWPCFQPMYQQPRSSEAVSQQCSSYGCSGGNTRVSGRGMDLRLIQFLLSCTDPFRPLCNLHRCTE